MNVDVAITGLGAVRAPHVDALPEPVRARAMRAERITQLALGAGARALEDAGLAATGGDPRPDLGIVLGTAFGCFLTNAAYQRRLAEGGPAAASPRLFAATVSNAAAGELSIAYRLGGPAVTLTAGGVAGLVAIGHAVDLLRAGQARVLVAGGVDAMAGPLARWLTTGGLFVDGPPGEGAAMLVLERADDARARNARIHGFVCGYGVGFDPAPAATHESADIPDAAQAALVEAGFADSLPDLLVLGRSWCADGGFITSLPPDESPARIDGGCFAATGPLNVQAALEKLPAGGAAVVSDHCWSGHVAAVVVRRFG